MGDPVIEQVPLEFQWSTIDPFLFCAHHVDEYPAGNDAMGPAASLCGRQLGQDFAGLDGWRMYHGLVVPGFPQHPHRGFETVTYIRSGFIDHSDSLGAAARFGPGDVQWMTAGRGIVHSEMFPLVNRDRANPLELFQLWLNLPSDDKLVEPHFAMLWREEIPRVEYVDDDGNRAEITVIAGELDGHVPPPPPPYSWAARPDTDVAIWHVRLEPGARWTLPAVRVEETVRTLYVFEGSSLRVGDRELGSNTGAIVDGQAPITIATDSGVEFLVLQGRPIGEPVAQYGPFVMNQRAEINDAIADYQRTGFGGWPWPRDDPVHARDRGRFARHSDGRVEEMAVVLGS